MPTATRPRTAPRFKVVSLDPETFGRLVRAAIEDLDRAGALASAPGGPVTPRDVLLVTALVGVAALALHEAQDRAGG